MRRVLSAARVRHSLQTQSYSSKVFKKHFSLEYELVVFGLKKNRKTLQEGGGVDATPPPKKKVLLSFFLEDKTSAPDIFSSYSFIPRANFETSLVMVRCYGYEIWRQKYSWLRQFWVKVHVFSTFFKNKIMPSQKLLFPAVLTWFLILGKIQDGSQDGDHCWWRHRPPAAPPPMKYTCSLVKKIKGFPLKVKLFQILQHIKNTGEGFHPSPPSCATVVVWICVFVRGLR